jgi:hypothetical protein
VFSTLQAPLNNQRNKGDLVAFTLLECFRGDLGILETKENSCMGLNNLKVVPRNVTCYAI